MRPRDEYCRDRSDQSPNPEPSPTYSDCAFDTCPRAPAEGLGFPLCPKHCRTVYLTVRDMLANTTPEEVVHYPNGRAVPLASKRVGIIYFARLRDLIKIGYTTNLKQRMAGLYHDHHVRAEVLATMSGSMGTEKTLHAKFGPLWVRGELFRPGPELMEYIAALNAKTR